MHMGERIREERERLGFNQSEFAELVSSTRKTLFNWESGAAAPNANALATWAEHGLDVLYVVTGQRTQPMPAAATLRPDQAALLDNYEHSDEVARQAAQRLLDPSSQRKKA